jgi:hypothetical protein
MDRKLLGIYLNDHLAGSSLGLSLARRALGGNRATDIGAFLQGLVEEIEADRRALEQLMDRIGVGRDRPKVAAAWGAEKLGRLKLNGRLFSYSPLSRLEELEMIAIGVQGKHALWLALEPLQHEPEFEGFDLQRLIRRAARQRADLERYRLDAAREAFAR